MPIQKRIPPSTTSGKFKIYSATYAALTNVLLFHHFAYREMAAG